jgi:hypothetical protein
VAVVYLIASLRGRGGRVGRMRRIRILLKEIIDPARF